MMENKDTSVEHQSIRGTEELEERVEERQKEYVEALKDEVMKIFEKVKQEVGAEDVELEIQASETGENG